jgi:hypothetical protein
MQLNIMCTKKIKKKLEGDMAGAGRRSAIVA